MNFGYVFDEGFTVPAAVSIYSLLYNNRHMDEIKLYILDDGIEEESRKKLTRMVKKFKREIVFVDVKDANKKLSETTKYNWNGRYSTYLRLMLNSLLPGNDEVIIMIDGDTIVNGRYEYFESLDLDGYLCAMALESGPNIYHKMSGLGNHEFYNGGLIAIDLKKWREEKAEEQILNYLTNVRDKNMLTDEDVLSNLFKGKIKRIPIENNFLTPYYLYASKFYYWYFGWNKLAKKGVFYTLDEMKAARKKAVMYHCIDTYANRPWFSNNVHPYTKLFDKYLAKTPWKDYEKKERKMSFLMKLEYNLRKYLPRPLSKFMYAFAYRLYYGIGAKIYYKDYK